MEAVGPTSSRDAERNAESEVVSVLRSTLKSSIRELCSLMKGRADELGVVRFGSTVDDHGFALGQNSSLESGVNGIDPDKSGEFWQERKDAGCGTEQPILRWESKTVLELKATDRDGGGTWLAHVNPFAEKPLLERWSLFSRAKPLNGRGCRTFTAGDTSHQVVTKWDLGEHDIWIKGPAGNGVEDQSHLRDGVWVMGKVKCTIISTVDVSLGPEEDSSGSGGGVPL